MSEDYIRVHCDDLKRFCIEIFSKLGLKAEDADSAADVLVTADMRGIESHGVGRLKYYFDRIQMGVQFAALGKAIK